MRVDWEFLSVSLEERKRSVPRSFARDARVIPCTFYAFLSFFFLIALLFFLAVALTNRGKKEIEEIPPTSDRLKKPFTIEKMPYSPSPEPLEWTDRKSTSKRSFPIARDSLASSIKRFEIRITIRKKRSPIPLFGGRLA